MIAFFPGQGSQTVGMGKELYEAYAIARETFEEASDAIRMDLKKLCFHGPDSDLTLTENTQPCLLTTSTAAFRVAQKNLGFSPKATAGHSLGEYSALVAAGALSLTTAVRWVRERGLAMQKAVPVGEGTMAAILNLSPQDTTTLCAQATRRAQDKRAQKPSPLSVPALVEPANFNSPGQVVIAGSTDAIQEALLLIQEGVFAAKAIPLDVSAPFHSKLMRPARDRMASLFQQASDTEKPVELLCPYVPNFTGQLTDNEETVLEYLVEQVDHPVLWQQSVETLLNHPLGLTRAVEFGPGKVLQGLVKRICKNAGQTLETAGLSVPADLTSLERLLK